MNGIKIDWLSFSLPRNYTSSELPDLISSLFGVPACLDTAASYDPTKAVFKHINKRRNYYGCSYRLDSPGGDKLVEVYVNPITESNRNTTLIQVTGYALSAYAGNPLSIDVPDLCRRLLDKGGKPTAVHIAADDTAGLLPWETILECVAPDQYRERIVTTSRRVPITLNQETVYIGNRSDRNQICIYRKDKQEQTKFRWVRVEYRTTDRATAKAIVEHIADGAAIGVLASGLILRHLDFKERSRLTKYNRPTCSWWTQFLGGVEKMIISRDLARQLTPKKERSIPSIKTLLRDLETHCRFDWTDRQDLLIKVQDIVALSSFDRQPVPLSSDVTNPEYDAAACADGISF